MKLILSVSCDCAFFVVVSIVFNFRSSCYASISDARSNECIIAPTEHGLLLTFTLLDSRDHHRKFEFGLHITDDNVFKSTGI